MCREAIMDQSRLVSLIEVCFNTAIGFLVAYIAWPPAAAMFGLPYTHGQHFGIVAFFTVISVARGYVIRRWFNNGMHLAAVRLAKKILGNPNGN